MCGIFGIIIKPQTTISSKSISSILRRIAILSESRGKDSSGVAFRNGSDFTIQVIKGDIPIRQLLKSNEYDLQLKNNLNSFNQGKEFAAFGHARLVTNGSQLREENNQPVLKDGMIIIHNGIIVNNDKLWKQHSDLKRDYLIDTEIIPALIRKELNSQNDLVRSCNDALGQLEGTYSIALMFQDLDQFVLATNNGSLYFISDNKDFIIFASESFFLDKLKKESELFSIDKNTETQQIIENTGLIVDLKTLKISDFNIPQKELINPRIVSAEEYKLHKYLLENKTSKSEVIIDPGVYINRSKESHLFNLLEYNIEAVKNLKRCTKCLLPETFPFIEYDSKGVCNYCLNYKQKNQTNRMVELKELIKPFHRKDLKPDCIVPFSGGRDSTFSLHLIKNELKLNPISYTYDWGMVTDLARRNIARVCGKLGVENIIVSADIRKKRHYIKLNIEAWLRKPDLGMIPLFMSGDKSFHYYLVQLQKQTNISLNIWGENFLEKTDFKVGFAGVKPEFSKERIYTLSKENSMKMIWFLAKSVLNNPKYLNSSLFDNILGQYSRSFLKKTNYFNIYDYYVWDEDVINNTITSEYDWEHAIDTKSTWRIGDGTSAFYNYIYFTVAGFSEFDTFRSNQIREGMINRDLALDLVEKENSPRYETLRWYFEIIGLDFEGVIKKVNVIEKLYPL
jgi:glutamine---fructose-6-phosphate transaminase (isomerizing)